MKIKALIAAAFFVTVVSSCAPEEKHYQSVVPGDNTEQGGGGTQPGGNTDPGTTEPGSSEGTFRVLFIGNSLTMDATFLLPSLLNAAGVKNVEMTRTFHGAYTLPGYDTNYANSNICSFMRWKSGQARWRGEETLTYAPKTAVEAAKYDVVCIQEYTGNSCCWNWTESEGNSVKSLINKIKASQAPNEPRFVFLFSTQYGRGHETLVKYLDNDPVKQFNANVSVVSKILETTGIQTVISTGALQQNLRTSGLLTDRDMTRGDLLHADYGYVRYAQACLVFKTIFTPLTGINPEDIPFTIEEFYPYSTLYTTPVTAVNKPTLIAAVNAAYEHPLQITNLSAYTAVDASYTHKPGTVMLDEGDLIEPVTFPVVFPLGQNVTDAYKQPYWNNYGIWVCKSQPQAYAKWNFASYYYPIDDIVPYRYTYSDTSTSTGASCPVVRGLWTGDWFDFIIPVKNFAAGTKVRFSAPFYTRQGPVFWIFEWLDGDTWRSDSHDITKDGFTVNASFALNAYTTNISCTATFENAVSEGKLHFRLRCPDGSIQADHFSGTAVKRDAPNRTQTMYSSVLYFHDPNVTGPTLKFEIVK